MKKKVVVLGSQVPFAYGGAELLTESLYREINKIKHLEAEIVRVPYKWYPEEQLLADIAAWRMLDISEVQGQKIDLAIATKFPSYAAKHDNKIIWLVHQHRQFYELEGGEYDSAEHRDDEVREEVRRLDKKFFEEAKALYSIANTVSKRAKQYNGVDFEPLYPPPPLKNKIEFGDYGDYILYMGRLDRLKRVDMLIHALKTSKKAKVKIIGDGRDRDRLIQLAQECGVCDRCEFVGYVNDERFIKELAGCRAVYYAPFDEDYGYAAVEAWLAKKPLITTADSGEPALFTALNGGGIVCSATVESISDAISGYFEMSVERLGEVGEMGYEFAKTIGWDGVIEKLVLAHI